MTAENNLTEIGPMTALTDVLPLLDLLPVPCREEVASHLATVAREPGGSHHEARVRLWHLADAATKATPVHEIDATSAHGEADWHDVVAIEMGSAYDREAAATWRRTAMDAEQRAHQAQLESLVLTAAAHALRAVTPAALSDDEARAAMCIEKARALVAGEP